MQSVTTITRKCTFMYIQISDTDREMIKKNIVGLMLKTPEALQRQLSDAITIIGKWKQLTHSLHMCVCVCVCVCACVCVCVPLRVQEMLSILPLVQVMRTFQ